MPFLFSEVKFNLRKSRSVIKLLWTDSVEHKLMAKFNNLSRITVGRIRDLNTIGRTIPETLLYYCPFIGKKWNGSREWSRGRMQGVCAVEAKLSFIILDSRESGGGTEGRKTTYKIFRKCIQDYVKRGDMRMTRELRQVINNNFHFITWLVYCF